MVVVKGAMSMKYKTKNGEIANTPAAIWRYAVQSYGQPMDSELDKHPMWLETCRNGNWKIMRLGRVCETLEVSS